VKKGTAAEYAAAAGFVCVMPGHRACIVVAPNAEVLQHSKLLRVLRALLKRMVTLYCFLCSLWYRLWLFAAVWGMHLTNMVRLGLC
jgi:hypothetical protein